MSSVSLPTFLSPAKSLDKENTKTNFLNSNTSSGASKKGGAKIKKFGNTLNVWTKGLIPNGRNRPISTVGPSTSSAISTSPSTSSTAPTSPSTSSATPTSPSTSSTAPAGPSIQPKSKPKLRIDIPPRQTNKDEYVITGDQDGVTLIFDSDEFTPLDFSEADDNNSDISSSPDSPDSPMLTLRDRAESFKISLGENGSYTFIWPGRPS